MTRIKHFAPNRVLSVLWAEPPPEWRPRPGRAYVRRAPSPALRRELEADYADNVPRGTHKLRWRQVRRPDVPSYFDGNPAWRLMWVLEAWGTPYVHARCSAQRRLEWANKRLEARR